MPRVAHFKRRELQAVGPMTQRILTTPPLPPSVADCAPVFPQPVINVSTVKSPTFERVFEAVLSLPYGSALMEAMHGYSGRSTLALRM